MERPLQKKYQLCHLRIISTDVHLSYEDKKKLYWCECGHNTNREHDMKRHKKTCKGKKKTCKGKKKKETNNIFDGASKLSVKINK